MVEQNSNLNHPLQLLSKRQLGELLHVNLWTLDRWRKTDPDFPAPIWLSNSTLRWRRVEVERWLASCRRGGVGPQYKRREAANA